MPVDLAVLDAQADALAALATGLDANDVSPLEAALEGDALFEIFSDHGEDLTSTDLLGTIDASLDLESI